MQTISKEQILEILDFERLVPALKKAFQSDFIVPKRAHHDMANTADGRETTLLLMPAWEDSKYAGVKIVTVAPKNAELGLPSILGNYMFLNLRTGQPLALMEATSITCRRTAAASALGSTFMSRPETSSMLMVGTGALSANLIEAHCSVRPIKKVLIWGRNSDKAAAVKAAINLPGVEIEVCEDLETGVKQVDLISVATLSMEPLIKGAWLSEGQHLDLVGAYRPDMREADDDCIRRCEVIVDTWYGATHETGEIVIPIKNGLITEQDIHADLFDLCRGKVTFTREDKDITLFKSTGHALEDLAAAKLVAKSLGLIEE